MKPEVVSIITLGIIAYGVVLEAWWKWKFH
jgi:hypothetical protein